MAALTDRRSPIQLHPACAASSKSKSHRLGESTSPPHGQPVPSLGLVTRQLDMRPHFTSHRRVAGQLAGFGHDLPVACRYTPGRGFKKRSGLSAQKRTLPAVAETVPESIRRFAPCKGPRLTVWEAILPIGLSLRIFPKIGSRPGKFRPIEERYTVESRPGATTCAVGSWSRLEPAALLSAWMRITRVAGIFARRNVRGPMRKDWRNVLLPLVLFLAGATVATAQPRSGRRCQRRFRQNACA